MLTASFSTLSLADACPSETSTAAVHVTNGRATSSGLVCSSCSDDACCQGFGADGYSSTSSYCYYSLYAMKLKHSCMSAETTYTSTNGETIASPGDVTLYLGDNGNWYVTDPADCGSGSESTPSPPPATSSSLTSGIGVSGNGVRPNIILAMNDSFLMNSEVLWTSSSGQSELTDLSRVNEMFVNYRATQSANVGYTKGAGYEALYSGYNSLAFDPTVTYQPWPGIDPSTSEAYADRHFVCDYRITSNDASNTANENKYCPKYFPEFENTLAGSSCSALNSGTATSDTKHCVLRDCMQGGEISGLHGCKEFVAINPTTTYSEFGQLPDQNLSTCTYTYPYTLGGTKDCLTLDAWIHYYPRFPHGNSTPVNSITGHCATCNMSDIKNCNSNVLTTQFCDDIQSMTFPAPDYQGTITSFNPFTYTCYNLNQNGQAHCQFGDGVIQRPYTNILRKYDLMTHFYTVMESGSLVTKIVAEQSSDIQKNYANWFTYYRTMGHVQKAAMLAVAYEAKDNDRLALADSSGITTNINTMSSGTHRADLSNSIAIKQASFTTLSNNMLNTLDKTYTYLSSNKNYLYESMTVDNSDLSANCRQNHTLMFTSGFWSDSTEPSSSSNTPSEAPVVGSNALSNVAAFMLGDIDSNLEDKVPVDAYSTISAQHIKTWVMQFDIDTNSDYDYGVQPSFSAPVNTSSNTLKRDDIGYSPKAGNGGYQKIENAGTAMSAATDLLSQMTTGGTMCPSVTDCGDSSGKRISWKELQKQ